MVAGLRTRQPVLGLVGLGAVWYGLVWLRVLREGRQLTTAEALRPWRVPPSP